MFNSLLESFSGSVTKQKKKPEQTSSLAKEKAETQEPEKTTAQFSLSLLSPSAEDPEAQPSKWKTVIIIVVVVLVIAGLAMLLV